MKTTTYTTFFGPKNNSFKPSKQVFLILAFLIGSISLQAQGIVELTGYLSVQKASAEQAVVAAAEHLETLLGEAQSTVYISTEITTKDVTPPVRAYVKASAVAKLSQAHSLFNEVELITVRLKKVADLNFVIDLLRVNGFPLLKYVYFLCEFECSADDLNKLFIANPVITVLYKISLAS